MAGFVFKVVCEIISPSLLIYSSIMLIYSAGKYLKLQKPESKLEFGCDDYSPVKGGDGESTKLSCASI